MNFFKHPLSAAITMIVAGGSLLTPGRAEAQANQGYEELTRGPVHEAFAETITYDPTPGLLVRTSPPRMIEEIPPEQELKGDNVAWIPGYWGWDKEADDFIWISGIWRNLPPGRQWIPGYWAAEGSQWQWTSGYWAVENTQEVTYYPQPPKSLERGPSADAPSKNDIWISGNWDYRDDRYAWRPGYWEPAHENWSWIPAHYQWTRRGYVFVDGYWDYDVPRRGVVFAPVRFQRDVYERENYYYTPSTVIAVNVFLNHLFVRPDYGHYYFGDYYAPRYRNEGYYTSFSYQSDRRGYDPISSYSSWQHRDDRDWDRKRREDYVYYRDNESARPPSTMAALLALPEGKRRGARDNYQFAEPLARYAQSRDGGQRFQAVNKQQRDEIVEKRREMVRFSQARQQLETRRDGRRGEEPDNSGKAAKAVRETFGKSPVMGKRLEQFSGKNAPPKRNEPRDPRPAPTSAARDPHGPETEKPRTSERGDNPRGSRDPDGKTNPNLRPIDPSNRENKDRGDLPRTNREDKAKEPRDPQTSRDGDRPKNNPSPAPAAKTDRSPDRRQDKSPADAQPESRKRPTAREPEVTKPQRPQPQEAPAVRKEERKIAPAASNPEPRQESPRIQPEARQQPKKAEAREPKKQAAPEQRQAPAPKQNQDSPKRPSRSEAKPDDGGGKPDKGKDR